MKSRRLAVCLFAFALVVLGQSDRGSITGVVSDPTGAVLANATGRNEARFFSAARRGPRVLWEVHNAHG